MRWWIAPIALGILARSPPSAAADDVHELRHDVAIDATVAVTATILAVGSELGKADLAPASCRWCEPRSLDPIARDALRWSSPTSADHVSNAVGLVIAPVAAFGTLAAAGVDEHAGGSKAGVDALLLYEAVSVSAVLNQLVKLTVGRERPFVHALAATDKARTDQPSDNDLSFYSGHTGITMTLAAASGTIATLRGYRLAPLVWSSGAAISLFTGYLRIAADKHWFTDVLVGALVGATVGTLVPLAFHGRRDEGPAPAAPAAPVQGQVQAPLVAQPASATLSLAF